MPSNRVVSDKISMSRDYQRRAFAALADGDKERAAMWFGWRRYYMRQARLSYTALLACIKLGAK